MSTTRNAETAASMSSPPGQSSRASGSAPADGRSAAPAGTINQGAWLLSPSFLWTLLILFLLAWLYALGNRTLVPTDEGRYAEMAREMLLTGDWITPRLNGIKYFEKPPLQTWMNAATFALFGLGEWQARLWTGLSSLIGIALAGYTGRRLFDTHTGLYAMLIMGSCFMWVGLGHINTLDMGLSGMMALVLCSLLLAQHDGATTMERRRWMLACWAGMALSVLSKGLIGVVLPGAVLVLYTGISRDWGIWTRLNLIRGLLLFFAICTPWFVLVSLKNPEFPHFFFIHEHFERFLTKVHRRSGPWHYFIPLLLLGITPWLGLLPQSLINGVRRLAATGANAGADAMSTSNVNAAMQGIAPVDSLQNGGMAALESPAIQLFRPGLMLVIWSAFIFFFFSYSSSKLPSYILPIFPALALLVALQIRRNGQRGLEWSAVLLLLLGIVVAVLSMQLSRFSFHPLENPYLQAYKPWMLAASGVAIGGSLLALYWQWRKQVDATVLTLATSGLVCWLLVLSATEAHGNYRAGMSLLPAFERELTPETKLYAVGMYDQTLPFYLRRTVTLVEHMDELEFGLKQQPELWIATRAGFVDTWQNGPPGIAIMSPEKFVELHEQKLRMRVLAQDSRRIVVSNQMVPARPKAKNP